MNKIIFSKPIFWCNCSLNQKNLLLNRPILKSSKYISKKVANILQKVMNQGDAALRYLNLFFDHINTPQIKIDKEIFSKVEIKINTTIKQAILKSAKNIENFHIAQKLPKIDLEILPGVRCLQIIKPISSVGLYVPKGSASLVSTALMLAIPAYIAGCKRVIICSPPPISDEIFYAAKICGVHEIYQVGGAQAIAAMAFGTESIEKVDKIFGPGNIWVTEAKKQISQQLHPNVIDMLAGPSELLIIADHTAKPEFIAADLLSQAEHDAYSQTILLTPSINAANAVIQQIKNQIKILPKISVIEQSLKNCRIIITNDLLECINISNYYAPEHLIIQTYDAKKLSKKIINAGSIFIGNWSPEAAGDYASGTNHVLPTYGYAKNTSGLGLVDFQKRINIQQLTPLGLKTLAPTIKTLTQIENLFAHEQAINIRINALGKKNDSFISS